MRILTTLALFIFFVASTKSDDLPQIPRWGYLPKLSVNHWDMRQRCKNVEYSHIPISAFDIGDSLHPNGKRASGVARGMFLDSTCIIAYISTTVYEAPEDQSNNHYTISVQVPQADSRCKSTAKPNFCKSNPKGYLVIFSRDIPGNDVGQAFRNKKMEEVVTFEANSRRVIFNVGNTKYDYIVPIL